MISQCENLKYVQIDIQKIRPFLDIQFDISDS